MPDPTRGVRLGEPLYSDALAVLGRWAPTSAAAGAARDRTVDLLAAGPVAMTRAHRPGHVTASTLVVDGTGRMLLCLHGRMNTWMQLGGHCEPGDRTLADAALREATEESGIAGLVLDPVPIDVDVHPVRCRPFGDAPATGTHHFDVRYLALAPLGATERVSAESQALGWFTVDNLPSALADGVRSLFAPAAARTGQTRADQM